MKRKPAVLLLAGILMLSLYACDSSDTKGQSDSPSMTVTEKSPQELAQEEEEKRKNNGLDFNVDEQVLVNANGVTITATGLALNEHTDDYTLELKVDNQSGQNISVTLRSAKLSVSAGSGSYSYVNGFQVSATCLIEVPDGETKEDVCFLSKRPLDEAGITEIKNLELGFYIHNDAYDEILDENQSLCSFDTTLSGKPDTDLSEDMPVIYEQNGLIVRAKYVEGEDETDKGHILAAITNNTTDGIQIRMENITVDGTPLTYSYETGPDAAQYSIGGMYYENAGRTVLTTTSFSSADSVPEITDSSIISFTMRIAGPNMGDWTGMENIGPLTIPR